MVQNRQKVKVGEIWPFLRLFSKSIFSTNIRPRKPKRSYKRFLRPKETYLRGIGYSLGRRLESGYSPGRIGSMHFLWNYTSNEAQTKLKMLFKA